VAVTVKVCVALGLMPLVASGERVGPPELAAGFPESVAVPLPVVHEGQAGGSERAVLVKM